MIFRVGLFVLLSKLLCTSADYGLASQFPELKIKAAGPSQQYNWIGYTPHFPKTVPRPLLHYRWQPYEDPTYTAFWVSEKENEVGAEYKDISAEIPHGFGAPKPSSLQAPLLDYFSGPTGSLNSYEDHSIIEPAVPLVSTYIEPNTLGSSVEDDFGKEEVYGNEEVFGNEEVYGKEEVFENNNVHIEESYESPTQIYEASPVIHTLDGDFGDGDGRYREIAVGHQDSYIEAGKLVHAEQYTGESNYQPAVANVYQPVLPLVKPPHSEPLPLETEAGIISSELLQDTYSVVKRSPKQPPKQSLGQTSRHQPQKSN